MFQSAHSVVVTTYLVAFLVLPTHKSLKTVWEESGEPTMHPGDDYYRDPRNIGRWVENKFQDMGQELPSQIKEKIQAAREGVLPEPLKDLGSASPTATYD